MDGEQMMVTAAGAADKFRLGGKWFWMGIAVALFNSAAGLIYGIALLAEKNHRKAGLVIIVFSLVWAYASFFFVGPWLLKSGLLPKFQIVRLK